MRIDRAALIRGFAAAAVRERERRQAAEQAAAEASWDDLLARIAEMGGRLVAEPRHAADRDLAKQLAQAKDWGRVDELRLAADRSRIEAVALVWTESPQRAEELLAEYPEYSSAADR